ncbi:OLC1v1020194C1 [Oldenlandia corymbosa var. corymbosa]|uniref:OLC1v1020194C1 n=1 Tax=Oldenlandia corymbosa var. corymbosa TaxID=529605 RepID=A0AAV1EFU1_OLDCO|nr:OLC1v1020194C1 [Oldenlandia corymbosa var. corymbosa]
MKHSAVISWILICLLAVLSLIFIKKWKKGSDGFKKKLPPGPWKLPIIGNIHQLMMGGSLPHHALRNLAQKHGDLMHLQLGEISTIVVSSPGMAKSVLKTHDLAFSDRPSVLLGKIIAYNYSDIAFSPYGEYWRQLRKLCTLELLSAKRVRSFGSIRRDEVSKLVSSIREDAIPLFQSKEGINLTRKISSYTSSMICAAAFGRAFGRHQAELVEILNKVLILASGFDVSDVFPSWKILHRFISMKPELVELHNRIDGILETIIQQHVENPTGRNSELGQEDLLDILLRIKQSGDPDFPITNASIKAVILDIFTGGTETSANVVEWAMAEMIRYPNVLAKAQSEIRELLKGKTMIEEADIQKLSYLKLVIKETLRLHPPLPLLIPRESRAQCEIDGYIIPDRTRAIVNVWAIGRDSKYWDDPENFKPERFDNSLVDFTGSNYELLPFGAGRRSCPGLSFGIANVELPLANLLFYFDWKLPNEINGVDLDMSETSGIVAGRKSQLFLIATMYEAESIGKHI